MSETTPKQVSEKMKDGSGNGADAMVTSRIGEVIIKYDIEKFRDTPIGINIDERYETWLTLDEAMLIHIDLGLMIKRATVNRCTSCNARIPGSVGDHLCSSCSMDATD